MKKGKLVAWSTEKGYGIIQADSQMLERYFLHISKITSAPAYPKAGMNVTFDISPIPPRKPNGFSEACDAVITAEPEGVTK